MSRPKNKNKIIKHPFDARPNATEQELLERHAELQRLAHHAFGIYRQHSAEKQSIVDRLKRLRQERTGAKVTDHALLAYLERFAKIDLAEIESKLEELVPPETRHGDVRVTLDGQEVWLVIRENHIVTVRYPEHLESGELEGE